VTPDVVVDIGNSRMKWGVCRDGRVTIVLRLPLDEPAAWEAEFAKLPTPQSAICRWAVASVNPPALDRFTEWASKHGSTVTFERYRDLPLRLVVNEPENVGLDRLCGAVAAKAMVSPGTPAITVDAGTAVTVNLIDAEGVFQGGAILPGPRLMARSLHEYTARLPLVETDEVIPFSELGPGKNTTAAIRLGIESAVSGGAHSIIALFVADECRAVPPWVFITGGASYILDGPEPLGVARVLKVSTLVLEGIRIAAEALP
jgi:type III pantothenate kinase